MNASPEHASSSRAVRKNALWNIFGQGIPIALAVLFIPRLISGIGTDRFGALTLVWTFLTYFSFFDMGLGRALTQLLSKNAQEDKKDEADLIWMTFAMSIGLGFISALILFFTAPIFASKLLRLQGDLKTEMILSLRELGFALPLLIHSLTLKGLLEAKRRFDLSNLVRIPLGAFTYVAPLLVLPFSHSLSTVVAVLLAGRLLAWLLNFWMVLRIVPHLKRIPNWRPKRLKELARFGGWVTVSNLVGPITDNMDRFFISALLSISKVAYYTTPFELASKLRIISQAIGGAIFPEFADRFHRSRHEVEILYLRGFKYLLAILFPIVLFMTAYAREGLTLWLNPEFALIGGPVLQWLALSMLIGGVAQAPFTSLLGAGRPHLLTLVDLFDIPFHAAILFLFLKIGGVEGAAIAFAIHTLVDFSFLFFFSVSTLKFGGAFYTKTLLPLGISIVTLLAFHVGMPLLLKTFLVSLVLVAYTFAVWFFVLEGKDKAFVLRKIGLNAP